MEHKVIAVVNQKGGVGKTTTSVHLTRGLQVRGHQVLLVDSDPQGSASDWSLAGEEQLFPVANIEKPTLERDLKRLKGLDYVIIDGVPSVQAMAVSAIHAADLVLIPLEPSMLSVWAAAEPVRMVQEWQRVTGMRPRVAFLLSKVVEGTNVAKEIGTLVNDFGIPVLNTRIHQRVAYTEAAGEGRTVLEGNNPKAKREIEALVAEVLQLLKDSDEGMSQ